MLPRIRFRGKVMFAIIGLIGLLLLANIFLTVKTNREIAEDKAIKEEADAIRLHLVETIRNLHLIDVGLRGYAIDPNPQLLIPFDSANRRHRRYLQQLETALSRQNFDMKRFEGFRDTVQAYFQVANEMKTFLQNNRRSSFDSLFRADPGFPLQRSYRSFVGAVNTFEERIASEAKQRYTEGLEFNSWIQIFLFILGAPTLIYIGYHASQTFLLAEQLHESEKHKVEILATQNTVLEHRVLERTNELVALNEEITAQNEEIQTSNDQLLMQRDALAKQHELLNGQHKELHEAKQLIEAQHLTIADHNKALITEVESQTRYLVNANTELLGHNRRLEQFAFVVSHNLRGPMTRILGLASIFEYSNSKAETIDIISKLKQSAEELDQVIKDLTMMTVIRNVNRNSFRELNLEIVLDHVLERLQDEIRESFANVRTDLRAKIIVSLEDYVENVLWILIRNAIQFRSSSRIPMIEIKSGIGDKVLWIEVRDNGMGIDLQKYGMQMFVPYRRFHFETKGKGLGLYTAKTQIETIGGMIDVTSRPNEGTTFRITLPILAP
jgi:signal transduction histidine kinase